MTKDIREEIDHGEPLKLESVRSFGNGNWRHPSCLVFTFRNDRGREVEAIVRVSQWRYPETGLHYTVE